MAAVPPSNAKGHTGDVAKQVLANVLEERIQRIRQFVDKEQAVARDELAKFVWGTARKIYEILAPNKDKADGPRVKAWTDAKGMLKELIDWNKFKHAQCDPACVNQVLEKKVAEILEMYRNFVLTGEIKTRFPPPKLLGETDEILCVDKPCMYMCNYGGRDRGVPQLALKHLGDKASASMLLNGEKAEIQLHEYLALKYNFETAVKTREWWKLDAESVDCSCGACEKCAVTQTGCCNRLDKETSGVMIVAKTCAGFPEIRQQFSSEHSLEAGGTEKYYLCFVHGEVVLPAAPDERNPHWKHFVVDGRGKIEVSVAFDKSVWKALPYDDTKWIGGPVSGVAPPDQVAKLEEWSRTKFEMEPQPALSFYEPVAWFEGPDGMSKYTLVLMQIITGRTHQIRFHMQQIGHPLVGDTTYGAPFSDRSWCPRVFLHSYQTKFREPFTERWFQATSPLPQDLGEIIQLNMGAPKKVKEGAVFKTRRVHDKLSSIFKQYDPSRPLLFSHDAPVNKDEVMRRVQLQRERAALGGRAGAWKGTPDEPKGEPGAPAWNSLGLPMYENGRPCNNFLKSGFCNFSVSCIFTHPEDGIIHQSESLNSYGYPIRPKESRMCRSYLQSRQCKHKENCKFNHPQDTSPEGIADATALAKKLVKEVKEDAEVRFRRVQAMRNVDSAVLQSSPLDPMQASQSPQSTGFPAPPLMQMMQQMQQPLANGAGAWGAAAGGWEAGASWKGAPGGKGQGNYAGGAGQNAGKGWEANTWDKQTGWKGADSNSWTSGGKDWKNGLQASATSSSAPPPKTAPAQDDDDDDWGGWKAPEGGDAGQPKAAAKDDDDDDDWGGWTAKKDEADKAVEPPAKKARSGISSPTRPPPQQQQQQPPAFQPLPQPLPQALPQFRPMGQPSAGQALPPLQPMQPMVPGQPAQPVPQLPLGALGAVVTGWKRLESRSQAGVYYYWNQATGETQVEPPPPWEKKESRSQPGVFYYWNPITGKTEVRKPEV